MKKKVATILLASVMALSALAGCGGKEEAGASVPANSGNEDGQGSTDNSTVDTPQEITDLRIAESLCHFGEMPYI